MTGPAGHPPGAELEGIGHPHVNAPGGPLAGEHASAITVVLVKHDGEDEIAAFHNTLITG